MLDLSRLFIKHHKAASVALRARKLSDKLLGQIVIKITCYKIGLYSLIYDFFFYLFQFNILFDILLFRLALCEFGIN